MSTTATLTYNYDAGLASAARITSVVGAVPAPLATFGKLYGAYITSDVTGGLFRTVSLRLQPTVLATATANLEAGSPTGSPITGFTITNPGLDYVLPPVVTISGSSTSIPSGNTRGYFASRLNLQGAQVLDAFTGGPVDETIVLGGMAPPVTKPGNDYRRPCCVQGLSLAEGGRGYGVGAPATVPLVQFVGGLGPGGVHATAECDFNATTGEITSVTLLTPGSGYIREPQVIIYDPFHNNVLTAAVAPIMGEGRPAQFTLTIVAGNITAVNIIDPGEGYIEPPTLIWRIALFRNSTALRARMGVGRIDVLNPGKGFTGTPTVNIVDVFNNLFPVTPAPGSSIPALAAMMNVPISYAIGVPVSSITAVF